MSKLSPSLSLRSQFSSSLFMSLSLSHAYTHSSPFAFHSPLPLPTTFHQFPNGSPLGKVRKRNIIPVRANLFVTISCDKLLISTYFFSCNCCFFFLKTLFTLRSMKAALSMDNPLPFSFSSPLFISQTRRIFFSGKTLIYFKRGFDSEFPCWIFLKQKKKNEIKTKKKKKFCKPGNFYVSSLLPPRTQFKFLTLNSPPLILSNIIEFA